VFIGTVGNQELMAWQGVSSTRIWEVRFISWLMIQVQMRASLLVWRIKSGVLPSRLYSALRQR